MPGCRCRAAWRICRRRFSRQLVGVGEVEDGGFDLPVHQRDDAVIRAGDVIALAESDVVALRHDVADRLGAAAACVEGEGLAVEVLPALVGGLLDDREEHEPRQRRQVLDRRLGLLHHRVGRRDADLGLAADHRLDRELFLGEGRELLVDAFFLGALERDRHAERLDRNRVAERDLHTAGPARRRRRARLRPPQPRPVASCDESSSFLPIGAPSRPFWRSLGWREEAQY